MAKFIPLLVSGGGVEPTGTLEIRSEGVFDVTNYAEVDVDIFDDTTTKSISQNGVYNAEDDGVLGYSQVTVEVYPALQSITTTPSTVQQVVEASAPYYGLQSVTIEAASLQNITITDRGTYNPTSPYIGFGQIVADVLDTWTGTQVQYDALSPDYDSNTLYLITD